MRLCEKPVAIAASVFVLHGATIIPRVLNEPLEIAAAWSFSAHVTSASARTSASAYAVSCSIVTRAHFERTRCVSTGSSRSSSRTRIP